MKIGAGVTVFSLYKFIMDYQLSPMGGKTLKDVSIISK